MTLAQRLARWVYARRCAKPVAYGDKRITIWHDLSIDWSSNVNPFSLIDCRELLPRRCVEEYFPGKTALVTIGDREITLDVIEQETNRHYQQAMEIALSNGNTGVPEGEVQIADIWFLQAGRSLLADGHADLALRAYLNAVRISNVDGYLADGIGSCLAELGDFEKAGSYFVIAGEEHRKESNLSSAADAFEKAGLAWEVLPRSQGRPTLAIATTKYDTTVCFQTAKRLYAATGDDDSVSRCFIHERDAHARWTSSRGRRCELSFMRGLWLYGESFLYSIRSIMIAWVTFALGYMFFGFSTGDLTIDYDLAWAFDASAFKDFARSLYFSAVTMSTLGYGDYAPASAFSKFFAGVQAFMGILFGAMLLVSLQRRYVGR